MTVTPDDLATFIQAKWKSVACPRCGENRWTTGKADEIKATIPVSEDGSPMILGPKHIPIYWAVCENCGHVEFISTKIVRAWQQGRENAG